MYQTETTETPEAFERKRYYQTLKLECLKLAQFYQDDVDPARDAIEEAKKFFRSITEERWASEPVEEPKDD